jgi:hypothetical protein
MTIWYILCSFGTFFSGFGIMCKKNLATLNTMRVLGFSLPTMSEFVGCEFVSAGSEFSPPKQIQ